MKKHRHLEDIRNDAYSLLAIPIPTVVRLVIFVFAYLIKGRVLETIDGEAAISSRECRNWRSPIRKGYSIRPRNARCFKDDKGFLEG